jgi:uncharacterized protein
MKCPVCNLDLLMMERQGVEIDYCKQCRGVWLDRGELYKIIERARSEMPQRPSREDAGGHHGKYYGHGEHVKNYDKHHGSEHDKGHYKQKRSFLMDLFD